MLIWSKIVELFEKYTGGLEEIVKFIWRWLFQYAAPFWEKKKKHSLKYIPSYESVYSLIKYIQF